MSEVPSGDPNNEIMSLEELSSKRKSRLQQLRNKRKGTKSSNNSEKVQNQEEKLLPINVNQKYDEVNGSNEETKIDEVGKMDELIKLKETAMAIEIVQLKNMVNEITEEDENKEKKLVEPNSKRIKLLKTGGRNYNSVTKAPVNSFEMEMKLPNDEGILSIVTNDAEENKIIHQLSKKFKVNEDEDVVLEDKKNKTNFLFENYKQDLEKYETELELKTKRMLKNILKKRLLESGK